ncbi:MAG: hypothetical protein AB7P08_04745 [Burkholderiales bacterium]
MSIGDALAAMSGIGILFGLAVVFLLIGDRWAKRAPGQGEFFPTLHSIAMVAALIGAVLAWMAFATDHPRKWLHLLLPVVFVAVVYIWGCGLDPAVWRLLAKDVRDRVRGKHAV